MKKEYSGPAEVATYEVVQETKAHGPGVVEFGQFKRPINGSVGFHV